MWYENKYKNSSKLLQKLVFEVLLEHYTSMSKRVSERAKLNIIYILEFVPDFDHWLFGSGIWHVAYNLYYRQSIIVNKNH